ncbi:MAG: FKBP-type peptidyl-prolyl cis-trans isomerase [bacterium]
MNPSETKQTTGKEVTTASGLKYVDTVVGHGAFPEQGDIVRVHYTGWLLGGRKFDSSVDEGKPFEFTLGAGRVIKGWDEGISTMKVGGKRKLIIPPNLGYGPQGAGGAIPPNSTLVFEIELLGIK